MPTTTRRNKRKRQEAELEMELRQCARNGNFVRLRELVELERINVNCADYLGQAPLMLAAWWGRTQVARFLLEKDAIVDTTDCNGSTAMSNAVFDCHVAIVELLLEHGANVETQCRAENCIRLTFSPLGYAIYRCHVGMVALLLRFGANTEEVVYHCKTIPALHCAYRQHNHNMEIVRMLIDHAVDINAVAPPSNDNRPPTSPLCEACYKDDLEMAQLLIQNGARVIYDDEGVAVSNSPCPLERAVENGSLELVRFLLDNSRFSVSRNENNNARPPEIADTRPLFSPLVAAIQKAKLDVAQLLVDRGANVNDSPLLCKSSKFGHYEVALWLLQAGANVNLANSHDQTPLWLAASHGNVELVKLFLKAKADVSIRDRGGETPLAVAHRQRRTDVVYLLLRTSPYVWPRLANVF